MSKHENTGGKTVGEEEMLRHVSSIPSIPARLSKTSRRMIYESMTQRTYIHIYCTYKLVPGMPYGIP